MPTFAAQKFDVVPIPELEPPVRSAGRPSKVAERGSRRGSYGIHTVAGDGVVVAGHGRGRARDPIGELGHCGFRDDDGAGRAQVFRQRGFIGRDETGKGQGAAGGRHVGGLDIVLEGDGDAVQRAAQMAARAFTVEFGGLFERVRIDGYGRMQLIFISCDALQVLADQFARGDASGFHRGAHFGDGGFDDGERSPRFADCWMLGLARKAHRQRARQRKQQERFMRCGRRWSAHKLRTATGWPP